MEIQTKRNKIFFFVAICMFVLLFSKDWTIIPHFGGILYCGILLWWKRRIMSSHIKCLNLLACKSRISFSVSKQESVFPSNSLIFEQDVLCHRLAYSLFSTVYAQITFYIPVSHKMQTKNVFQERQKMSVSKT